MSSTATPANHPCPCLAELLRTRYYPPSLTFRVERIIKESCRPKENRDASRQSATLRSLLGYRLLLSDGDLMINATVKNVLHRLIQDGSVENGSLIEITKYDIRKTKRLSGKGSLLYLAVEDFQIISDYGVTNHGPAKPVIREESHGKGQEKAFEFSEALEAMNGLSSQEGHASFSSADLDEALLSMPVDHKGKAPKIASELTGERDPKRWKTSADLIDDHAELVHEGLFDSILEARESAVQSTPESDQQDSDGFETITLDSALVSQRRQALFQPSGNTRVSAGDNCGPSSSTLARTTKDLKRSRDVSDPKSKPDYREKTFGPQKRLSEDEASQQDPPRKTGQGTTSPLGPVHTLISLLKPAPPLPQKTYRCTIFGLISWVSPSVLKKPGFPPKRHVKIHDQSISHRYSGISVSIFHDAQNFVPKIGTIALFRGLTAQWWEKEVILNAYEKECMDGEWVLWDEDLLETNGFDVQGLKRWWEQRNRHRAGG